MSWLESHPVQCGCRQGYHGGQVERPGQDASGGSVLITANEDEWDGDYGGEGWSVEADNIYGSLFMPFFNTME